MSSFVLTDFKEELSPEFQTQLGFDDVVNTVISTTADRPPQQPGRRSNAKILKCDDDLESVDSFWGVGTATAVTTATTATTAGQTPVGKALSTRTPG